MSSRPGRPAHCGLYLVTPERPEGVPLLRDVGEGEPCLLEKAFRDVHVIGCATHRQRIQRLLPGLLVDQLPPPEGEWIKQVREMSDSARKFHEPIVVGPSRNEVGIAKAECEIGWLTGR
jgi:hypothetical protein